VPDGTKKAIALTVNLESQVLVPSSPMNMDPSKREPPPVPP
jgi:hypothetical protein